MEIYQVSCKNQSHISARVSDDKSSLARVSDDTSNPRTCDMCHQLDSATCRSPKAIDCSQPKANNQLQYQLTKEAKV